MVQKAIIFFEGKAMMILVNENKTNSTPFRQGSFAYSSTTRDGINLTKLQHLENAMRCLQALKLYLLNLNMNLLSMQDDKSHK